MNILVFDTETTSLVKPFCYNIGYCIYDTETNTTLIKREYVVEQIWHNLPLFSTAYYTDKRPLYVKAMRARKVLLEKFGYITQQMCRDINDFEIVCAYAFNSSFDERVFEFNCDYFKCINPFDTIPIFDIRGNVHKGIAFTTDFQSFCETNQYFTESGNYSTTAETIYRYLFDNEFNEAHTALSDSEIELDILIDMVLNYNQEWNVGYKAYSSVPRRVTRDLIIKLDGEEINKFNYISKSARGNTIYLKSK